MPEIELHNDPFGANRGKSFREQASSRISVARKRFHDKHYIPPYRPTNRNWEMTFASLGYNRKTIEKFWKLFCQINGCTGAIQLEHFLEHFDLDWTPWTERCFTHFDTTGGGDIDFLEFMISVWNVCTFKIDSLSNFTFDMYDLDSDGEMSIPEIEGMVKELFGEGGGQECLREAIDFAEARGGALNLNSFIAFTGTHQLLLFPIFQIQRKLQRRVFGIKFWEKVERSAKENFNDHNKNEFNPRHVQILLRTYQTGGAAAVLSHTGDPNKGLRDWYDNKKEDDEDAEAENGAEDEKREPKGWNLLKDKVNTKAKVTQGWSNMKKNIQNGEVTKVHTLEKIKDFKHQPSFRRKGNANENTTPAERPTSGNAPAKIAEDLERIRARRNQSPADQRPISEANNNGNSSTQSERPTSANVANDLKHIRAKRNQSPAGQRTMAGTNDNGNSSTQSERPTSANAPANVAEDLKRIRAKRNQSPASQRPMAGTNNDDGDITPKSRPTTAELPANVAADLERIRAARRTRKATKDDDRSNKVRPRPRTKSSANHNNVRRRQAGSMFFKPDTNAERKQKGWLE